MRKLSHVDEAGRVRMVDVSSKPAQLRRARAVGHITLSETTAALIAENNLRKGDVLTTAEIAGIQAAKRTAEWIPLCHPVPLSNVQVQARLGGNKVVVSSEAVCVGQTGVEMEALVAVSAALLTVYDMCKAVDSNMTIGNIVLVKKEKGPLAGSGSGPEDSAETPTRKARPVPRTRRGRARQPTGSP